MINKVIDVYTVHFGSYFWTELLVAQLGQFKQVGKIHIAFRTKHSANAKSIPLLHDLARNNPSVVLIENHQEPNQHASFDHAEVLKDCLDRSSGKSKTLLIVDTDILMKKDLFSKIEEEVTRQDLEFVSAVDPNTRYYSHPCFMLIDRNLVKQIDFSPHLLCFYENKIQKKILLDTGRTVTVQISKLGGRIGLLHVMRFKLKRIGDFYCSGSLIHLKSRTFASHEYANPRWFFLRKYRYTSVENMARSFIFGDDLTRQMILCMPAFLVRIFYIRSNRFYYDKNMPSN